MAKKRILVTLPNSAMVALKSIAEAEERPLATTAANLLLQILKPQHITKE